VDPAVGLGVMIPVGNGTLIIHFEVTQLTELADRHKISFKSDFEAVLQRDEEEYFSVITFNS
jgi:hypothetical protein